MINTEFLTTGAYIILFNDFNGRTISKKVLID